MKKLPASYIFRVLVCVLSLVALNGYGQQFTFLPKKFSEKKSITDIRVHGFPDTLKVEHDMWSAMVAGPGILGSLFKFKSIHDIARFYVNHDTNSTSDNYSYKVAIEVLGWRDPEHPATYEVNYDTLSITYRPDSLQAYQDLGIKKYSNYHKMWIIVTDVYDVTDPNNVLSFKNDYNVLGSTTGANNPPGVNCGLEAEIWQQKFDKTYYEGSYPVSGNLSSAYQPSSDILHVDFWDTTVAPKVTPALYELEWTYVDNYKYTFGSGSSEISPYQLHYDFKQNATRIITDKVHYDIPVVYEKGYLVFRVRMVRPDSVLYIHPIYSTWSVVNSSGLISSLSSGTNYYKIDSSHVHDSLNWQYTVSFAEGGKYKQVLSYFDGSLKPRQSITRFNSRPNQLIATENIYDYKGRPSISILPTPVPATNFRFVDSLSLNATTGKPYDAKDFDTLQPPGLCPLEYDATPLLEQSRAARYYSHTNPDTITEHYQKFVPEAFGYPFVQTVIAPEDDKKILKQGGAGDKLQLGQGHNTKFDYVEPEQSELNRMFGTEIGYSEYYKKTAITDPNGQTSISIADNAGRTIATSMVGLGPDSSTHPVDPMNLPGITTFQEDLLYGISTIPVDNVWYAQKSFFVEAPGDHQLQYAVTIDPFPLACAGKYLTVSSNFQYDLVDDCGNVFIDTSGTLGTTGVTTSSTAGTFTGPLTTAYLNKGKHTVHKTLSIAVEDVYDAVEAFLQNPDTCLHDVNYFIRKSVEEETFPCPGDSLSPCDKIRKKMIDELLPHHTYAQYNTVTYSLKFLSAGSNSIFTYDSAASKYRYQICDSLHWPDTVRKNGRAYTNIRNLPIDTFIYLLTNNPSLAAVLLPLHPDYCLVNQCISDNYDEFLQSLTSSYTKAQQQGYFTLNDLIIHDPLYIGSYVSHDSLSYIAGVAKPLDSIAVQVAYCGGADSLITALCYGQIFSSQIGVGNIAGAPAAVKQGYIEQLIALYISNRSVRRLKYYAQVSRECGPCQSKRMTTIGVSHFPPVYNSTGGLDTMFLHNLTTQSNGFTPQLGIVTQIANSSSTTAFGIVSGWYNAQALQFCDSNVAHIVQELTNCTSSPTTINAIKTALYNYYCTGAGVGQRLNPDTIRHILTNNGVAINDLCNQFLINYNTQPVTSNTTGSTILSCKPSSFYTEIAAFLNNTTVHNILNNPGTSYSLTLAGSNAFQQSIADVVNGGGSYVTTATATYNTTTRLYCITITGTTINTLKLWFQQQASTGVCSQSLSSLTGWYVINASCISTGNSSIQNSLINEYTFKVNIGAINTTGSVTDTTVCSLLAWNDGIPTLDTATLSDKIGCITCQEMKDAYQVFKDTLASYGLCCVNHQLYDKVLTNYMNYHFGKQFMDMDYLSFMRSCALADSLSFKTLTAEFKLTGLTNSQLSTLITNVNSTYGVGVNYFRYQPTSTSTSSDLYLSFSALNENQLLGAKNYITTNVSSGNRTYNHTFGNDTLAMLFVPAASSFTIAATDFANNTDVTVATGATVYASYDMSYVNQYTCYVITHSTGLPYYKLLQYTDSLENFVMHNSPGCQLLTSYSSLLNEDYYTTDKKAFLNYNYAFHGTHAQQIGHIEEDSLKANVTAYSGKDVSYDDPKILNERANLFISTPDPLHPGYQVMEDMLNTVANTNSGQIFFTSPTTIINTSAIGSTLSSLYSLNAYKCGNGFTYWYRLFAPPLGNHLYDLYLNFPPFITNPQDYRYVNAITGEGDGEVYRFKVRLYNSSNVSDTIVVPGYSDFSLGLSRELQKSLLCLGLFDASSPVDTVTCERQLLTAAIIRGQIRYQAYIDSIRKDLRVQFLAWLKTHVTEHLYLTTRDLKYQFTLYYYDRAGNLDRTITPEGVHRLPSSPTMDAAVNANRDHNTVLSTTLPKHKKNTYYRYNSRNELVDKLTPDLEHIKYFPDWRGRPMYSQTQQQSDEGVYSYTLYDPLDRVVETGEVIKQPGAEEAMFVLPSQGMDIISATIPIYMWPKRNVIMTRYDSAQFDFASLNGMSRQQNLIGRVSAVRYYRDLAAYTMGDWNNQEYNMSTYYSYDLAGNVKTLIHEYPFIPFRSQRFKRVDYDYDLVSGKVNMISYNRGLADQFYQRYQYDEDNRIVNAETSNDGITWDHDANYKYYQHGPLARTELGDLRVQALDNAYTIQGWIKAVNSDVINPEYDMGHDGNGVGIFPKDVFGYKLDYFPNDYTPIASEQVAHIAEPGKGLYNGNIVRQTTALHPFEPLTKDYRYDPLNRLTQGNYYNINQSSSNVLVATNHYRNAYSYDGDGNIKTLTRVGNSAAIMDSMRYLYTTVSNPTDKLRNVLDGATNSYGGVDIPYYPDDTTDRFIYDADGRLIRDYVNAIDTISWNHFNKVDYIVKNSNERLDFLYDGTGNRIYKRYLHAISPDTTLANGEIYVRDATGNILATIRTTEVYADSVRDRKEEIKGMMEKMNLGEQTYFDAYAGKPSFQATAIDQLMKEDTTAADAIINSAPATDYFSGNHYLLNNALHYYIHHPEKGLSALKALYNQDSSIVLKALAYNPSINNVTAYAAFRRGRFSRLLTHMSNWWPSVFLNLRHALNVPDSLSYLAAKDTLLSKWQANPAAISMLTAQAIRAGRSDSGGNVYYRNFTAGMLRDSLLWKSGPTDREATLSWLQLTFRAMGKLAEDSSGYYTSLSAFFSSYPNPDTALAILKQTIGRRLMLANQYRIHRDTFAAQYINSMGSEGMAEAIAAVPGTDVMGFSAMMSGQTLGWWGSGDNTEEVNLDTVKDALGQLMRYYEIGLAEHHLYGSSRLGIKQYLPGMIYANWKAGWGNVVDSVIKGPIFKPRVWYSGLVGDLISGYDLQAATADTLLFDSTSWYTQRWLGHKQYELTDHLGNVQATVLDRLSPRHAAFASLDTAFTADVNTANDYYPFGMLMPGRSVMSVGPTGVTPPLPQLIHTSDVTLTQMDPDNNWYQYGGYTPGIICSLSPTEHGLSYSLPAVQGQNCRLHLVTNTSSLGDQLDVVLWQMNPYTGIDTIIRDGITPGGTYDLLFSVPATGFIQVSLASHTGLGSGNFRVDSMLVYLIGGGALTPGIVKDNWDEFTGSGTLNSWGPNTTDPGNTVTNVTTTSITITQASAGQGAAKSYSLKGNTHYRFKMDLINPMPNNDSIVAEVSEYDGSTYQLIRRSAWWKDETRYITSFDTKYSGNVMITVYGTNPDNLEIDNAIVEHLDDVVPNSGNVPAMFASGYNLGQLDLDKYRFGFNGKQKDNEIAGIGNFQDYGFRMYNPRIARFISIDPFTSKYPMLTPYQFASNMPIWAVDLDGKEAVLHTTGSKQATLVANVYYVNSGPGAISLPSILTSASKDLILDRLKTVNEVNQRERPWENTLDIKLNNITMDESGAPLTLQKAREMASRSTINYIDENGKKQSVADWRTGVVVMDDFEGNMDSHDYAKYEYNGLNQTKTIYVKNKVIGTLLLRSLQKSFGHEMGHFLGELGHPGFQGLGFGITSNEENNINLEPTDVGRILEGAVKYGIKLENAIPIPDVPKPEEK